MKLIASLFFVILLLGGSVLNIINNLKPLKESIINKELFIKPKETLNEINNQVTDDFVFKFEFIEIYGYIQRLLGKNEESNFEVIKDTDGGLHYSYFANGPKDVTFLAERVIQLHQDLNESGVEVVALMPPDKYIRGYTRLAKGLPYSYANETADNYLDEVRKEGVRTIDFRESLLNSGIPPGDLFFKTDHHWQIETAFWAYTELIHNMKEMFSIDLDPTSYYTDKSNFNFLTYKNSYLGSMGRKTGTLYTGVDDFTLIYPKFKTDFSFHSENSLMSIDTEGRFEDALVIGYPFNVSNPQFSIEADKYFSYVYGNQAYVHIKNNNNRTGPKVLFIKDSMSVPLAAFLSLTCSDVYLVDPRYYEKDIPTLLNGLGLDYVFVSIYPPNLTEEFFPYYQN